MLFDWGSQIDEDELLVRLGPENAEHLSEMVEMKGEELVLNMGPQHPSTHGVLRLQLVMDGEIIKKVIPHIGYLHRCFEKHAESVPYNEVIPYTDRMDYVAAMAQNLGYVVGLEQMLGIEIPERVEYIRVLVAELQRIASHLVAVGTFGLDVGAFTPFLWCFRDREEILDLFEWLSGARMLYNYIWVGGLARDLPEGFAGRVEAFLDEFEPHIDELNKLLSFNKIFIERTAKIGILPPEVAISYGCTGPVLRGSGVKWDLRKDEPYSIYDRLDFDVVVGTGEHGPIGSVLDRYMVRVNEMRESVKLARQVLVDLPKDGDVHEAIPRRIRPPKGDHFYRTESPRGELGFYIVSDGSDTGFRIKARSPCFCNISVLDEIARGCMVADLVAIVGSIDIVLGEVDR